MVSKWTRLMLAVAVVATLGLGFGCEKEEPTPGQQLDKAMEEGKEGAADAGDAAGKAIEDAGNAVQDAAK